jgi:hypothetical protein
MENEVRMPSTPSRLVPDIKPMKREVCGVDIKKPFVSVK